MINVRKLIPGVEYKVTLKSDYVKSLYEDIEKIKIVNNDKNAFTILGHKLRVQDNNAFEVLIEGSWDQCKNYVEMVWNVNYSYYNLKCSIENDAYRFRNSTDPEKRDLSAKLYEVDHYLRVLDCDWELETILLDFYKDRSKVDEGSAEEEQLISKYVNRLKLQFNVNYGYVDFIENFKKAVDAGDFNDDDGSGHLATADGEEGPSIPWYQEDWSEYIEKYPFVVWYNK